MRYPPCIHKCGAELIGSPEIDIAVVTVKVPHHFEIVAAAIQAGKQVYCEWPLGNGLAEAQELTRLAHDKGVLGVAGTQARFAPEIEYVSKLIADGFVGQVLSSTLIGSGMTWGPRVEARNVYLLDRDNGATMLTIPFGHTMAAVRTVLGDVVELSARLASRRTSSIVIETGETKPMTSHDQVLVDCLLENGAPLCVHYRGGMSRGTGLQCEIHGSEGDLQVTGASGHAQLVRLSVHGARHEHKVLRPLDVPQSLCAGWPQDPAPGNVARVYARMAADLRNGSRTAPSFDDGVALHGSSRQLRLPRARGAASHPNLFESDGDCASSSMANSTGLIPFRFMFSNGIPAFLVNVGLADS